MYLNSARLISTDSTRGFSLIELMISMLIMTMVSLAMVEIAANSFRTNIRLTHMIQLSQEMRSVIQLVSRDIRRAGYKYDSLAGFLSTQTINSGVTMGEVDETNTANCLQVQYEDLNGVAKNVVYRLRVVSDVGRVSANFNAAATCETLDTSSDWIDVSDPLLSHISGLEFVLDNQLTDIAENLDSGNTIQLELEQISIVISATLRSNTEVNRSITTEVQIRNQSLRV